MPYSHSGPHLALLLLHGQVGWGALTPLGILLTSWMPKSLLTANCKTDCICCGWPYIWFHNAYAFPVRSSDCQPTHLFPPVYTGASRLRNPQITALLKVNMQHHKAASLSSLFFPSFTYAFSVTCNVFYGCNFVSFLGHVPIMFYSFVFNVWYKICQIYCCVHFMSFLPPYWDSHMHHCSWIGRLMLLSLTNKPINETRTGITTLGQSEHENNDNEGVSIFPKL